MVPLTRDDDLALLRAELLAQRAAIARLTRRRRLPRRLLPLLLAALLVALIPLSALAVTPFTDLTGGPHDGNIDLIFNAQITKGCAPTEYCPTRNVTREEMASFVARTAGLGGNLPVVNAAQLGGQPANAYALKSELPASGGPLVVWSSFSRLTDYDTNFATSNNRGGYGAQGNVTSGPRTIVTNPNNLNIDQDLILSLDIPRTNDGKALRVASYQVCFSTITFGAPGTGARITQSAIVAQGVTGATTFGLDTTIRQSADRTCYEVATPDTIALDASLYLRLRVTFSGGTPTDSLTLYNARLTLIP